jgi:predicted O-methyltransferase YrrM
MIQTYKDIQGWFDYANIYDKQVDLLKNGSTIVEVGCWLGKSSCYLAEKIKESGKKIKLFCVDIWEYTDDDPYYLSFRETHPDLLKAFQSNVNALGFSKIIKAVQGESAMVSQTFHDESIDFIFLDGNHHSPFIDDDLKLWYPKLKYGGCIAGHDYIDAPDVRNAVNKFFHKKVRVDGSCWIYYKMAK